MLSKRLLAVLDYLAVDDYVADIGCDHGYLMASAIDKGLKKVQLIDNKISPLNVAKKNLASYDAKAHIKYTLSDGLKEIDKGVNVACICGMGGDLIAKIISDEKEKAKKLSYLVLAPNSKVANLHQMLNKLGFSIVDEKIVEDHNKFYFIMKVSYGVPSLPLNDIEISYGKYQLIKEKDVYSKYLMLEKQRLETILKQNKLSDTLKKNFNNELSKIEVIINETK